MRPFPRKIGSSPDVEKHNPDIQIFVFVDNQKVTLYLDTSGESLFKRGWRRDKGEAPLKRKPGRRIDRTFRLGAFSAPYMIPSADQERLLLKRPQSQINMAPGITRRFGFEKFKFLILKSGKPLKLKQEPPSIGTSILILQAAIFLLRS